MTQNLLKVILPFQSKTYKMTSNCVSYCSSIEDNGKMTQQ